VKTTNLFLSLFLLLFCNVERENACIADTTTIPTNGKCNIHTFRLIILSSSEVTVILKIGHNHFLPHPVVFTVRAAANKESSFQVVSPKQRTRNGAALVSTRHVRRCFLKEGAWRVLTVPAARMNEMWNTKRWASRGPRNARTCVRIASWGVLTSVGEWGYIQQVNCDLPWLQLGYPYSEHILFQRRKPRVQNAALCDMLPFMLTIWLPNSQSVRLPGTWLSLRMDG
jgi:hypothetical protein